MNPMNIRYDQRMAIAFVVIGPLLLLSSLATSQMISVAAGAVLTLLGILMLVNPMLRIEPTEVQLRSPIGATVRRFAVSSPADLRLEGNKLHHVPDGKKIMTLGFQANNDDVEALRSQLVGAP